MKGFVKLSGVLNVLCREPVESSFCFCFVCLFVCLFVVVVVVFSGGCG